MSLYIDKNKSKLDRVEILCDQFAIYRMVDENREIFALLHEKIPDFLKQYPNIKLFLEDIDMFLVGMIKVLEWPLSFAAPGNYLKPLKGDPLDQSYVVLVDYSHCADLPPSPEFHKD